MRVNDPGKLLLLGLTIVGCFTLLALAMLRDLETGPAWGLLGIAVGYLTGNGRLASAGKMPEPTITSDAQQASRRPQAPVVSDENATVAGWLGRERRKAKR